MLQLDQRTRSFLTADDGALVRDEHEQPIPVAIDISTGKRFAKVAEQISKPANASGSNWHGYAQAQLRKAGAEFVQSDDSHFRGWWAPVEQQSAAPAAGVIPPAA